MFFAFRLRGAQPASDNDSLVRPLAIIAAPRKVVFVSHYPAHLHVALKMRAAWSLCRGAIEGVLIFCWRLPSRSEFSSHRTGHSLLCVAKVMALDVWGLQADTVIPYHRGSR